MSCIRSVLSPIIAVPAVLNESNRAKQNYQQQKSCVDRQMSLLSAENAITDQRQLFFPLTTIIFTGTNCYCACAASLSLSLGGTP